MTSNYRWDDWHDWDEGGSGAHYEGERELPFTD